MRFTITSLIILTATACSGPSKNECNDGIDNDGDGLIDQADPGCLVNHDHESPDPKQCSDTIDNDGDGKIDYPADPGCNDPTDNDETDPVYQCDNGIDDDMDGKIDYPADPGCQSATDNDERNPPECMDSIDDDGDGKIDYPNDPGCTDAMDDDETDPAMEPQCADGLDNDLDGLIDFPADPGCSAASDNDEFNTTTGPCGPGVIIADITLTKTALGSMPTPGTNVLSSPTCGGGGGEAAFTYQLSDGPKSLLITTDYGDTTLDTVLYVRTMCMDGATELACNDDGPQTPGGAMISQHGSTILLDGATNGTYYIVVDAATASSVGSFHLTIAEHDPLHGACNPADPNACLPGDVCRPAMMGASPTCEPHECQDGLDNDGDGLIDYPLDPGCATAIDDDETDPMPEPQCANMIDDDGDGLIDYPMDPGCAAAGDDNEQDECVAGDPITIHPGGTVMGDTTGGPSLLSAPTSCDATGASATSSERVYQFTLTQSVATLHFDTIGSSFDTLLYVRSPDCGTAGTACDDDTGGGGTSSLDLSAPALGTYYAIVDGKAGAAGAFDLTIQGYIALGGMCTPGDPTFVCAPGGTCPSGTCVATQCNNGVDDDADGKTDDFDPGCDSISDDSESPDPSPLPQCANMLDDDGDGLVDYPADPGCTRAADNTETDCAHDFCTVGAPLVATCDPCVGGICLVSPSCCTTTWDSTCVFFATIACGVTCP
jgi:hypothetical protein